MTAPRRPTTRRLLGEDRPGPGSPMRLVPPAPPMPQPRRREEPWVRPLPEDEPNEDAPPDVDVYDAPTLFLDDAPGRPRKGDPD